MQDHLIIHRGKRAAIGSGVAAAFAVALVALQACTARADVKLPDVFADHMVLQREKPIRIWGHAAPGEQVAVKLDTDVVRATADDQGDWVAQLAAREAGGPYVIRVEGANTVELKDVLIGDVFLASGQSNMSFRMQPHEPWTHGVLNYEREIAAADNPSLRFYTAVYESYLEPQAESHGLWVTCNPRDIRYVSAVSYYFAAAVQRETKVPTAVLIAAVGATSIASWLDADTAVRTMEGGEARLAEARAKAEAVREKVRQYDDAMPAYREATRKALQGDGDIPHVPEPYENYRFQLTGFYNGMIAPLHAVPIKGFIWYQGEADAPWSHAYPAMFKGMIKSWRAKWKEPNLPFYFVQLPNFDPSKSYAGVKDREEMWPKMREAQATALDLPHTGMAISADVGDATEIHPSDKKTVGERLALLALADLYGKAINARGPAYKSFEAKGSTLLVHFQTDPDGLYVKNPRGLVGFEVAGADGVYHPAKAKFAGVDAIELRSDRVPQPASARYAWNNTPEMSVYDAAGLPLAPFRTTNPWR